MQTFTINTDTATSLSQVPKIVIRSSQVCVCVCWHFSTGQCLSELSLVNSSAKRSFLVFSSLFRVRTCSWGSDRPKSKSLAACMLASRSFAYDFLCLYAKSVATSSLGQGWQRSSSSYGGSSATTLLTVAHTWNEIVVITIKGTINFITILHH